MNRTESSSISGLVVTLAEDATATAQALAAVASDDRFTLGQRTGNRLPLVLEADDDGEAEDLFRWLSDLPGVRRADVVYVRLAEDAGAGPTPRDAGGHGR